jgi:hypothetical protein
VSDPMLPIGSNRCQCTGCGRYFASVSGFDRHQRITDGVVECRDPGSIVNLKTGEHSLILNKAGYWQGPEMAEIPVFTVTENVGATEEAA